MRGVMFGDKHSYHDWGLMLKNAPEITSPKPKTHYVDILGAHGMLDLTENLTGKVQYKNRTITLEFVSVAGREEWSAIYTAILSELHGRVKDIRIDEDPSHIYTGRVTVGDPVWDKKGIVTLKMTAEVNPYKKTIEGAVTL